MATYVNNLRLKEIATGAESGTWGTSTNTNLELIADALGSGTEAITTNADTHTTTIADGAADEGRALFLKYTGTLDSACTITLAPNTINKVWFIENATSGSQNIIISQGSGANITIGNGKIAVILTDGAGSGAAVLDAFADLELSSTLTVAGAATMSGDVSVGDDLTLGSDAAVLNFGADSDVSLTHVADTGLLLNSTRQLQFYDGSQYIAAASTSQLDIAASAEVEITTTLVDINANVDVSGTSTLTGNVTMSADASVGDDLTLGSDAAILNFGADSDVSLTHVHDTGLLLNSTRQLQFFDGSQYIAAASTSQLDIVASSEIQLDATAVDLNGTLDVSGTSTFGDDISVGATDKIYLDGGTNTYITESTGDTMSFYTGGNLRLQINAGSLEVAAGYDLRINATDKLYLDGGSNTYIKEISADVIGFYTNGVNRLQIDNNGLIMSPTDQLWLDGGGDTYITESAANLIQFVTGSADGVWIGSGGLYIGVYNGDNQIIDASTGGGSSTLYIGNQAITTSSDRRLKTNIVDSSLSAVDVLNELRVTDFDWDDPSDTSFNNRNARGRWSGLIAQEVVEHLPFVVNAPRDEDKVIDHDSDSTWSIEPMALCGVLVKAIQELNNRIKVLESQIPAG